MLVLCRYVKTLRMAVFVQLIAPDWLLLCRATRPVIGSSSVPLIDASIQLLLQFGYCLHSKLTIKQRLH